MSKASAEKLTPLMQQYFDIKSRYPDALLLFQVGDFYELFFDDAVRAAEYLAIALTKRGKVKGEDVPLCGVPMHAIEHYLIKLVNGGFTVAVCDQTSKPIPGTVVERAVTRVYTPGTLTDTTLLDEKRASYFSIYLTEEKNNTSALLCSIELLTGSVYCTQLADTSFRTLEAELTRFYPDEIICDTSQKDLKKLLTRAGYHVSTVSKEGGYQEFEKTIYTSWITAQFGSDVLEQSEKNSLLFKILSTLYRYLERNQTRGLTQLNKFSSYQSDQYLLLDPSTQKNLEIFESNDQTNQVRAQHTLFHTLDCARTPMGSRMIKKWLMRPLRSTAHITRRHEIVEYFLTHHQVRAELKDILSEFSDVERIVGRVSLDRATQSDYRALGSSLGLLEPLKKIVENSEIELIDMLMTRIKNFRELSHYLERYLPTAEQNSLLIKPGADQELDRLRDLAENGQQKLYALGNQEAEKLAIPSLKVGFTSVAGYYFEVTKTHVHKVPDYFTQTNTLANRTRYISEELKKLEAEINSAREQVKICENKLYQALKKRVLREVRDLRMMSFSLGTIDGLYGFAEAAYKLNYTRPEFLDTRKISIQNGRHPVVEKSLERSTGQIFVPNNTELGGSETLWLITGPNMGGKSTYLRQVALIVLMAQAGSFVPAESATLPIHDRIFSRIGAGDNLAQGKSTFLVEMEETAYICKYATEHSLVILDEVGRGTSTDDGRVLAQGIIEYLISQVRARVLFATHYHELTHLSSIHDKIKNYHMLSHKENDELLFLHKLEAGVSHASFGIDVAKLAEIPEQVIRRARELLAAEEDTHTEEKFVGAPVDQKVSQGNYSAARRDDPASEEIITCIKDLDPEELTPRQAFDLLWSFKKRVGS